MFQQSIRRRLMLVIGLILVVGLFANQRTGLDSRAADAAQATGQAEVPIQVPPGFVVERVAGSPLVEHPVMAGFDDRGRLFVAESAGHNFKAVDLLKQLPNSIRRLEDSKGAGRFDKSTVFADQMTFPMGSLWHDGALYVCSPPSLWRLEDTKGAGVADQRQELVTKFGFTGNAADIHGPFLSPDGRLYWTDGRHGHEIKRPNGSVIQGKAARIFRCKPDGSDVEVVCGGGMDDPVGMAFTEEGEPFATVDILIGSPRRIDGIIYCIEGGAYPYHESVLHEFKKTGDLLPPIVDLGWVAPSGLTRYRGTAFGAAYRDNLFSAQFNTHKVQRHILERDGATFRSRTEDFLVSTSPDFHPTDVLEDADGSLLVIDTGGWFRIGCPTSQIAKPEVKGAIYRVRRKDAVAVADPRGLTLQWNQLPAPELAKLLDDPRWVVRDCAVQQLAKQKDQALSALKDVLSTSASVQARRNAVWALTRIESDAARQLVRTALGDDTDASVRIAAAHAVGLHRDHLAGAILTRLVQMDSPAVRREAATALGRIGRNRLESSPVPILLKAVGSECDRFLEHALIYALIEIRVPEETLHGLHDLNPRVRRAALIALDQMDGGNLNREQVIPQLDTDDPALQKTVWAMITARPEWANDVSGLLRDWLARTALSPTRREMLRTALLSFCKDQAVQELVVQALARTTTPTETRLLVLETMAQAPMDKLPKSWVAELGRDLQNREERVRRQTVATVRARGVTDYDEALTRLASDQGQPAELRVAALGTVVPRLARIEPSLFDFLRSRLDKELPPLARLAAADALGNSKLTRDQLLALCEAVAGAGSMELPHLIAAYEHAPDAEIGKKLLAVLDRSPGLTSLSPDNLRRTLKEYPADVQQAATTLLKRLEVDTEKQKAKLDELASVLGKGDVRRGKDVFFGKKAACAACHTVGAEGGRVGPDLTKIGGIRTGRDLLEAVVFPSASIVRGFEPYVIVTQDGRSFTGIIGRETAEAVYLVNTERTETRIPRSAIETIERGRVSIMPQGLDAQLNPQELGNLIAYLQSLR